ncbi:MAG: hypothetical protein PHN75_16815, partial [Syntrophales bacterium]|nr:hypothetical protein [Syntrophales bacterium]
YGYSLALGAIDISLWDLVNAYRTLANGGRGSELRLTAAEPQQKGARHVLSRDAAFIVSHILADRESRGPTFGLENYLSTRFWTAVKTGTSKDMRDNWCIGYSDRYTVGVWIGNFTGEPMWNVTGISGAAPVWQDIMDRLHAGRSSRAPAPPPGVVAKRVEYPDGTEPPRLEWFLAGTESSGIAVVPAAHVRPRIVYPVSGSIISLDPDIPLDNQFLALRAEPEDRGYEWRLNNRSLCREGTVTCRWRPEPGRQVLSIIARDGQVVDTVTITVR